MSARSSLASLSIVRRACARRRRWRRKRHRFSRFFFHPLAVLAAVTIEIEIQIRGSAIAVVKLVMQGWHCFKYSYFENSEPMKGEVLFRRLRPRRDQ